MSDSILEKIIETDEKSENNKITKSEQELITNKYELVDWIYKEVMNKVIKSLKKESEILVSYRNKLKLSQDKISSRLHDLGQYVKNIDEYKKKLLDKEKTLQDKNNNLQNIYDKMIKIEKRLDRGEGISDLPPLNLDFSKD